MRNAQCLPKIPRLVDGEITSISFDISISIEKRQISSVLHFLILF